MHEDPVERFRLPVGLPGQMLFEDEGSAIAINTRTYLLTFTLEYE